MGCPVVWCVRGEKIGPGESAEVGVSGSEPDRLTGLEEASMFAERRLDELHEQVLALSGRVEMLGRRLERVEHALRELRRAGDEEEQPGGDEGWGID